MAKAKKPAKTSIKVGSLIRGMDAQVEIRKADDGTTRFKLSLSSEYEVDRGWGMKEVLSHDKGAIRLDRAKSGAMPLLFNHNWDDPVGMVDGASILNKRLVVEGNFFATQRAQDVATMVAGGLKNVSVGYRINKLEEDCENDVYTITDWEPYEASIAPVPADPTVGEGRAMARDGSNDEREIIIEMRAAEPHDPDPPDTPIPITDPTPEARTTRASSVLAPAIPLKPPKDNSMTTTATPAANGTEGAAAAAGNGDGARGLETPRGPSSQDLENGRIQAINNMCQACNISDEDMKRQWISAGTSVKDVSDDIMRIVAHRNELNKTAPVSAVGLSARETRQFSIVKAVLAASSGDWKDAGFEAEASREIARKIGALPNSKKFYVPYEVQQRSIDPRAIASYQRALNLGITGASPLQTRADTVATANTGGYLVETANVGFIELLRNRSVAYRMGATQLSGLVGNVNVPRQTAAATAVWMASETSTITEAEQTFGQMALSPHTVGAYTEISRELLLQSSPGIEGIVNADLSAVAAIAVDLGVLIGSGSSGQPTGIKNVSGVGTAASGDMATIAYLGQLDYQVALANANVMPARGGYVTTPTVAKLLMTRTRFANTNTPLWDGNLWDANGAGGAAGFPGMSTNQMPASAMYFGDWATVIVAEWGVLSIETNPFANFQQGIIGIRAMMTIDVGLRYPAAFCIQGANIT
jgi:HK97 family phage major capsid protein/HK97 family phage prohead protease